MAAERPLDGKTALVTGASAGIGRETARALARDGASVAVAARREPRLTELVDELESEHGVRGLAVPTDVTDERQVVDMVDATVEAFDGIDIVVSNAGVGRYDPIEELSTEDYRLMMDVNVDGMFFTTRASIPHLRESRGNLIFVGSFAAVYPRPHNPLYAATKWWTRGFALSLAGQIGGDDIGVSIVHPSEVRTEWGAAEGESSKERYDPGEVTEAADVADAIAFAARQEPPNAATEIDLYRRNKFEHF